MKINSTPVYWTLFFLALLVLFAIVAYSFIEPREIIINDTQAEMIALKISDNEDTREQLRLIRWPDEDEFSSLGIAPFFWHPHKAESAELNFNDLLEHLALSHNLPEWLNEVTTPPWDSREDFFSARHDAFKYQLRDFLQQTKSDQVQYLIKNLEANLPRMLKEVKNPFARMHAYENFYHVAVLENGVYALLDYSVFMGNGLSSEDRHKNLGWGLVHVLENMRGNAENLVQAFASTAEVLLMRRIESLPNDERRHLIEWRRRINTYVPVSY